MSFNGLNHIASGVQYITFTVPATPELLAATESLRESGIATVQAVDITAHTPPHDDDRAEDENMPALATEPEDSDEEENGPALGAGTPRTPRNAHSSSSRSQATSRLMVGSLYSFIQTVPEPLQGNSQGIRPVRRTSALVPTSRARRRADAADSDAESVNSMPSLQTVSDSSEMEWIDESDSEEESGDEGDSSQRPPAAPASHTSRPAAAAHADDDTHEWSDFESDEEDNPLEVLQTSLLGLGEQAGYASLYSSSARANISEAVRFFMDELDIGVTASAAPERDHRRAKTIMNALESVSQDLVRRYEDIRAGANGESCEGCAICREQFIPDPSVPTEESETLAFFTLLPECDPPIPAQIVVFPCKGMHLFHGECIEPWLARKTTCPTCRFDVDPDSLTLTCLQEIRARSGHTTKPWKAPKRKLFVQWLDKQERKIRGETDGGSTIIVMMSPPNRTHAALGLSDDESEASDSDALPPLVGPSSPPGVRVTMSPHPIPVTTPSVMSDVRNPRGTFPSLLHSSMLAALAPLQAGPLYGDLDDLYSADFPRPTVPVVAQTLGQAPPTSAQSVLAHDEEDYEDLPPLIPSEEDGGQASMPYSLGGNDEDDDEWEEEEDDEADEYSDEDEDDDEDDEDLPPLIGEDPAAMFPVDNSVATTMERTMAAFAQMLQQHVHATGYDDLLNSLPHPPAPTRAAPRSHAPASAPAPPNMEDLE